MTAQRYNPSTGGFSLVLQPDLVAVTSAKVMVNGDTLFNVTGDILICAIISECYSDNDATASTLQYQVVTGRAATQTITAASATLASKTAGTTVTALAFPNLTTAPTITNNGVVPAVLNNQAVRTSGGTVKSVIGVGSTTGTWKHYLVYRQLEAGSLVTAAF